MITAGIMSNMPDKTCTLKGSSNTIQPIITAVNGSSAPSTAVSVLPIRLTLYTKLTLVTNVHITASDNRFFSCKGVDIGEKLPCLKASAPKIMAPINIT